MKKKNLKAKEPVKVRFKALRNGSKSIYLDYYQDGVREYEFLKLYIIPERSQTDKLQNEETLKTANAIKAQRIIFLQTLKQGALADHFFLLLQPDSGTIRAGHLRQGSQIDLHMFFSKAV